MVGQKFGMPGSLRVIRALNLMEVLILAGNGQAQPIMLGNAPCEPLRVSWVTHPTYRAGQAHSMTERSGVADSRI